MLRQALDPGWGPRWTLNQAVGEDDIERARQRAVEKRLVAAAADGSKSAFEQLYRMHVGTVYGLCLRMTANPATAEDCTQEAFIQAWKNLHRFEARSRLGTWLHRIAVNAVLAQGRKRTEVLGKEASVEDTLVESVRGSSQFDDGAHRDLEAAIEALPAGARHTLILAGIYGYTHEETAEMLGVAVGTCKAQLHRARRMLLTRLREQEED